MRRVGCLAVIVLFSIFLLGGVTARLLLDDRDGDGRREGPPPQALIMLIPLGLVAWAVLRGLRQTAAPIGEVMGAASRVAEGDYSVRVEPRGSPDVSELIRAFNAMASRLEVNEEQRRMLQADIAHELRNPLSIIRGYVEGIIDGVYPADAAHLSMVLDETTQMTRLLEELQTLSMAEAGVLALHRESVDIGLLISDVVSAYRPAAEAALVTLSLEAETGTSLDLDPFRIRQVLENLLANAVRHTPAEGLVQVELAMGDRSATIRVRDSGQGIPPDDLPHIFDRFTKSADSGGSGLGLAIARRLIEAHGGTIGAESSPGQGAVVTISLPR